MKHVIGIVLGLVALGATGCCHHGFCGQGFGACPPGGCGPAAPAYPVYPQTGAVYSTIDAAQANYAPAPQFVSAPVASQPVFTQTAMTPLEALPTY